MKLWCVSIGVWCLCRRLTSWHAEVCYSEGGAGQALDIAILRLAMRFVEILVLLELVTSIAE
jgi:hypothetical protein